MASERVTDAMRRIVAARTQNYCEYCRCSGEFATESFTDKHTLRRLLFMSGIHLPDESQF